MTNSEAHKRRNERRFHPLGIDMTFMEAKVVDGDPVNHPNHYTALGATCTNCGHDIECIDITRHMGFLAGNAVKYLWRADHKGNRKQDLMKARAYIDRMLEDST